MRLSHMIRYTFAAFVLFFMLFFWTSDADGKLSFQPLYIPAGEMELIDLDGDKLKDIVVYTYTSVLVFWHHPNEGFRREADYKIESSWANEYKEDFSLTDMNADGLIDIFHVKECGAEVYLQKPKRTFETTPDTSLEFKNEVEEKNVWLIDLGDVSSSRGLEIVTLGPDGVMAYELGEDDKYNLKPVVKSQKTLFLASIESNIYARKWPCPWNFCMDANGDGKDDIFLPQMRYVDVILQGKEGTFTNSFKLKTPIIVKFSPDPNYSGSIRPLVETRTTSLWTELQAPTISCRDVTGDGKTDIILDRVYVFAQKEDGGFPENGTIQAVREPTPKKKKPFMEEVLDEYCDVNGDGITDRVYQYRPWSTGAMKSDVKIFLGDGKRNLFTLDPEKELPDTKKVGGNFLFEAPLVDLDGDGALDILMFDTKYKITEVKNWIEIQRGRVDGEVHITFFNKKKNYFPSRPDFRMKLKISYAIRTYQIFENKIFDYIRSMISPYYDFTGDGRKDLLVRVGSDEKEDTLYVYKNTGSKSSIFESRPSVVLKTPNFHHFKILDVNSDGVNDFILMDSNDNRVGILMSYYKVGL